MRAFIRTDKDLDGTKVYVENGFRGADGKYYLLLHRLPPEYAKPPVFLVELSGDRVEVRGDGGSAPVYHKAYAFQSLNEQELKLLAKAKSGKPTVPFLNFSYPNVIRILGKQFECLSEDQTARIVSPHVWKLIGGVRQ